MKCNELLWNARKLQINNRKTEHHNIIFVNFKSIHSNRGILLIKTYVVKFDITRTIFCTIVTYFVQTVSKFLTASNNGCKMT